MIRAQKRRVEKQRKNLLSSVINVIDITGDRYILPPLAQTGESNDKCYAKSLKSCRGGISREHYISKNILQKLKKIDSGGIPWLAHLQLELGPDDLTAKCLCEGHNNHLSTLDNMAGEIFDAFERFGTTSSEAVLIWGPAFEQWLLKVLLGLFGTKKLTDDRGPVGIDNIPIEWVEMLFGIKPIPHGLGLFSAKGIGQKMEAGLTFSTLILDEIIVGMRVVVGSMEFYLSMVPKEKGFNQADPNYSYILHHPNAYFYNERKGSLHFHW